MADEKEEGTPDTREHVAPPPPPRRRSKWKWAMVLLGVVVVLPLGVFALWAWITLSYTYSRGDRAGWVQKISKKGWVCRTWEGELAMVNMPGAAQERWLFSVRSDSIARIIQSSVGNRVALEYEEHRGVPTSCFGETQYFIVGVRKVNEP
ncbi:MAG TPA: hypothetical protein VFT29_13060 [Gemmatimonadaceae bacterium]|nr:hypothetical protein [Gemmatimonadaceae bacterium]